MLQINQIQEKLQTLVALEKAGAPIRGSECNCFYYIKDVEFPSGIPLEGFEYNLYSSEACVPGQPSECNKFSWVFNSHLPDCDPSGAFPGCFDIGTQFGTFQAKKPFNCTVPPFSTNLPVTGLSIGLENDCLSSFPFEFPTVTINISCSNFINKGCNKETSYQSQDVVIDLGNDFTTYLETALFDLEGECGCTPVFTGFL